MEKIKSSLKNFIPGLPKSDLIQLAIFLGLFAAVSCVLVGNWPGFSYVINNGAILLICFFTIALPPNTRIYYLFSTALPVSGVIDLLTISLNFSWNYQHKQYSGFLFFLSFFVSLFLIVGKVVISLHQFEIAKTLNSERSPVSLAKIYTATMNAITLQQTVKSKLPEPIDIEANPSYCQPMTSFQQTESEVVVPVPQPLTPPQAPKQPQQPPANFKAFKTIKHEQLSE